jgi:hypothetical protein
LNENITRDGLFDVVHWTIDMLPITDSPPDDICVTCLEQPNEGDQWRVLPCQHKFHPECIDDWLKTNFTCPICRKNVSENNKSAV